MKTTSDISIGKISWLHHGGKVSKYFEPQNVLELINIVNELNKYQCRFDLIGHTSNTYFKSSYNVEAMVSTRLVNSYIEREDSIICDCGVSVRQLSRRMVNEGIKGFEGLIDLPGTVAASVYGNASCFGCSINKLLLSYDFLLEDGSIVNLKSDSLQLSHRSSALKRGELKGVILRVYLKKEKGDKEKTQSLAASYTEKRRQTQPGPANNLGSIFVTGSPTILCYVVKIVSKIILCFSNEKDPFRLLSKRVALMLRLLRHEDLLPYLSYGLNRYIWKDETAHVLFERYSKLYRRLYRNSEFEIEIKQ